MKHFKVRVLIVSLGLGICSAFLFVSSALGQSCEQWGGKIVSVQGEVQVQKAGESKWMPVGLNATYCPGDMIRVLKNSRAAIVLSNETLFRLDQNTTVTFTGVEKEKTFLIEIFKGVTHFFSRQPRRLKVVTPFLNAAVEGTEFYVRVAQDQTFITIFEGRVAASNKTGSLVLAGGQSAVAVAGKAPVLRVVVRPRDAVQWALYYPPIIDYKVAEYQPGTAAQTIQQALDSYWKGDLAGAFTALERVSRTHRDARYLNLRAGLLLTVGRVDEARSDIEQTLKLDPRNGTAFALRSIIEVVQNEKDQALKLANEAAQLDPQSPVPRVALSYAYQANFEIKKALESSKKAAELDPENSLAWARVSELELSAGELDRALKAARKAVDRNPDLARTQTVLGFAYLTQIKIKDAKKAFKKAIELDSSAPLPRLGLGLALIRKSDLKQGRAEIEIAASLDPNNALIRSYLGKAYFEEKQVKLAQTQFDVAKGLDPKDPTAWFYDAILKQTENRPVEALHDLQKSIGLNDNRAVYRSRLLLDHDQAIQGTSLARIYDDLGFDQVALVEASKSLSLDPANHSAHRFLSDTYTTLPRHEIARVSELLQAQLLQPINVNPVQPRIPVTDLNIIAGAGPAEAAFNEFTPLFERDRIQLVASGLVGNNETWSDEVVISGLYDRFSYSIGQFHFETDGFRENNDIDNDIYNAYAQIAATPKLNLQAEYRRRDTDQGDIGLNFNPDNFSNSDRFELRQDTARFGVHYNAFTRSDLIFSLIYQDQEGKQAQSQEVVTQNGMTEVSIDERNDEEGYQAELQHIFRTENINVSIGGGWYDVDVTDRTLLNAENPAVFPLPCGSPPCEIGKSDVTSEHQNAYFYSNIVYPKNMTWTFGLSYDSLEDDPVDLDRVNPKVGLQWDVTNSIRLRLAAFKTLKRVLIVDQTIEPTQVSGFNQFFDDFNGTKTTRYGGAVDFHLTDDLYAGMEFSHRDLDSPIVSGNSSTFEDRNEDLYSAYIYWTPHSQFSLTFEPWFEKFKREEIAVNFPKRIRTTILPLTVRYFSPSGFFAEFGTTYIRQKIDLPDNSIFEDDRDDFVLVDAAVGYRFPKRWGIVSLEVKNLFDEEFLYQDDDFRTPKNRAPSIIPDRSLFARITLNF